MSSLISLLAPTGSADRGRSKSRRRYPDAAGMVAGLVDSVRQMRAISEISVQFPMDTSVLHSTIPSHPHSHPLAVAPATYISGAQELRATRKVLADSCSARLQPTELIAHPVFLPKEIRRLQLVASGHPDLVASGGRIFSRSARVWFMMRFLSLG
jgi:hypothetical protein